MKRPWLVWVANLVLATVYFVSGKFGLSLAFVHASATAVWPPSGLALAAVLLIGYRVWPGIFAGAFLVNLTAADATVGTCLGIALGNTLETVVGAWLVNRFANGALAFEKVLNVAKFITLAPILSTMVSATIGVISLFLGGFVQEQFAAIWLTWWLGDMISGLIIAPLVLIWSTQRRSRLRTAGMFEALLVVLLLVLVGEIVFHEWLPKFDKFSRAYMVLPPLLWAAFRFKQHGASLAAFVLSAIAISGTLRHAGPFAMADPNDSLLMLQIFLGTAAVTALVLATVVSEREQAEQYLRVQHAANQVLAEAVTLNDASVRLLQVVCETAGWESGVMWRVDKSANVLRCVQTWHLPAIEIPEFETITRERTFAKGTGLPGRIWASEKPTWIKNVTVDKNFPRAPVASKEGLHGAFGFPLLLGHEVLGVIEFFSRQIRESDEKLLQTMAVVGSQIGQFIERTEAEAALRESETRLRTALDAGKLGVWEWDVANNKLIWSDRLYEFHGVEPTAFAATVEAFLQLLHPDDSQRVSEAIRKAVEEKAPYELEFRTVLANGEVRWFKTSARVIFDERGKPLRMLGGTVNLTEQKHMERELREAQDMLATRAKHLEKLVSERTVKLEETVAELEAMSYSIAHDLRAPLRAMRNYSTILLEECANQLAPEKLAYLRRIASAAERLDRLIQDVLIYSLNARNAMELGPVDLHKLARETIEHYPAFQRPQAEVIIEGVLPSVLAHETSLGQCISNLLGNAVKFISPETLPRVKMWAEMRDNIVRIWFEDNGIGIASRDRERIFRIFERVHPAEMYGGTGIGLSIVKKAIERMGGKVGVESELDKGSRFWIQLLPGKGV